MAEETKVEETTEQESPTVEQEPVEEVPEASVETKTAEQERNWRAVREELESLKAENQRLKGGERSPLSESRSEIDSIYMTPDETMALSKDELKAEIKFPELETKNIYSMAVLGEYRSALDKYNLQKSLGVRTELPSVYEIAKRVRTEYDSSFGEVSKKAQIEGARKAQESVEKKEATVEVESRSDKSKATLGEDELRRLQDRSRHGDISAIAERLSKSNL